MHIFKYAFFKTTITTKNQIELRTLIDRIKERGKMIRKEKHC